MSQKTKIVLKVLAWQERRTVYNMVYTVDEGKSKMTKGSGGIYEKHKERLGIYPVIDITRK